MKAGVDWQNMRPLMVGWGVTLSIGAMFVAIILYRQSFAEDTLSQTSKQWRVAQQRLTQYASYESDISFYLAHSVQWQRVGLMQLPDMNQWESALAEMQQQFSLPHLEYEIQSSASCAAASCPQQWPFKQAPEFNFTVTPIHLKWSVDHESAVIPWLQHLRTEYAGMLVIRRCEWRLAESAQTIAAQCDLDMFNFPNVLSMEGLTQ